MKAVAALLLVFALGMTGCKAPRKFHAQEQAAKTAAKKAPEKPAEEISEVDFQAFVGRLRKAAAAHDIAAGQSARRNGAGGAPEDLAPELEQL